jgi:hypothetical protein
MCCAIMHIMHNFPNPRCMQCTKCRAGQSDRPLKSCHIEHLLWSHGSSLIFARGILTGHFFTGERSIQSLWSAWSRWSASIGYVHEGSLSAGLSRLSALLSDPSRRYMHEIVHDHAHVQTDQVKFCACTCAHMHKTDLPIAPNSMHVISWTLFHRHRWDAIPPRNFFIVAHHLKFLCTLHKRSKSCA